MTLLGPREQWREGGASGLSVLRAEVWQRPSEQEGEQRGWEGQAFPDPESGHPRGAA